MHLLTGTDDSDDGDDADIPAVAPVVPNPRQKSSRIADKKGEQKRNQRGALGQLAKSTQEEEGVNDNEVEIRGKFTYSILSDILARARKFETSSLRVHILTE
jgi:hypothetical protein